MLHKALIRGFLSVLLLAAALAAGPQPAMAQEGAAPAVKRGPSGLPLPRFVSLKSGQVNMRVGPGSNYGVEWLYLKPGLPMEIIQEYDNWRRVRDVDGAEGWINQALLSGKRTGIAAPWYKGKQAAIPVHSEPERSARPVVEVEPGTLGEIELCNGEWCRMSFAGHEGWIDQSLVWGVYPGETLKE